MRECTILLDYFLIYSRDDFFLKKTSNLTYLQLSEVFYKTNKGFSDSQVKIKIDLICLQAYKGTESAYESHKFLEQFKNSKKSLKSLLGSADIAMLMVKNMSSSGIAASLKNRVSEFPIV